MYSHVMFTIKGRTLKYLFMAVKRKRSYGRGQRSGNWKRALYDVGASAVGYALRSRGSGAKTKTKTQSRENFVVDSGTFREKVTYRRRRAPARVRRRARKAFRRGQKLLNSSVAANYIMYDGGDTVTVAASTASTDHGDQAVWAHALYACAGDDITLASQTQYNVKTWGYSFGDITQVMYNLVGRSLSLEERSRMEFSSAVLEYNLTNVGTGDTVVEVYEWVARRDVTGGLSAGQNNMALLWDAWMIDQGKTTNVTASGTAILNTTMQGVTPFQTSFFGSNFLILKKRVLNIPAAATVKLELKDRKPHVFMGTMNDQRKICLKGITKGYLFIAYGLPVLDVSNSFPVVSAVKLAGTVKRTYKVRFIAAGDYMGSYTQNHAA